MKKTTMITVLTLLSTSQVFASEMRDASLKASSKASDKVLEKGGSTVDATVKVADMTAGRLRQLISEKLQSSFDGTAKVGRAVVKLSEVSKPAFQLTAKGVAMVFDVSAKAGEVSLDATKKVYVLLEPSSNASKKVLEVILDQISKGSEVSSDVSGKILDPLSKGTELSSEVTDKIIEVLSKVLEKPFELTGNALEKVSELASKGSEASTDVSNKVIGKENIEAGLNITGDGISLTSKGIGGVFYLITKGVTGLSDLFGMNKEEIQKAVEREDQETLAGLREMIRADINNELVDGELINALLSDADLDQYIEIRLALELEN